jgi:hypothetical protein
MFIQTSCSTGMVSSFTDPPESKDQFSLNNNSGEPNPTVYIEPRNSS